MQLVRNKTPEDWTAFRKKGIGGSDISAVLGLNKYRGAYDVWLDKTGQTESQPENAAMHFGTILEDVVAKEFQDRTGLKIQRLNGTIVDDFKIANVDRFIVNPSISKNVRWHKDRVTTDTLLECKTAGAYTAGRWGESQETLILKNLPCPPAQMPIEYLCQVQWYLGITGCQTAYVAVLIGGQDFRIYRVDRDEEAIAHLFEKAEQFWLTNVIPETPPEPSNAKEADAVWTSDNGEAVEADNDTAAAYGDLLTLKAEKKRLDEEIEAKEAVIKLAMRDNQVLTMNGDKIATWKTGTRNTIDSKRLKEEMPDVAKAFTKTSETRTLRIF